MVRGLGPQVTSSRNAELHALDEAKAKGIDFEHTGLATHCRLHCIAGVWTDARAKCIYDETMHSRIGDRLKAQEHEMEERLKAQEQEMEEKLKAQKQEMETRFKKQEEERVEKENELKYQLLAFQKSLESMGKYFSQSQGHENFDFSLPPPFS